MKDYISIGIIIAAHGIHGMVKIRSFTRNPSDIGRYKKLSNSDGSVEFTIKCKSSLKDIVIAEIDGVKDRNESEKLINTELFVHRSELPSTQKNEFYIADLIGLTVTHNKEPKGIIIAVYNFGAGDIIEIKFADNQTLMYSFTTDRFSEIDFETDTIEIKVI